MVVHRVNTFKKNTQQYHSKAVSKYILLMFITLMQRVSNEIRRQLPYLKQENAIHRNSASITISNYRLWQFYDKNLVLIIPSLNIDIYLIG